MIAQGKDWKTAKPIGFYSRQYRAAEFNYPTHEQEMLAIVECMKHWYPQLTGTRFEVLTDHAPLKYWKTQRDLSKRQARWLDFLCDFDFDIKHIPGITNTAADALSRYPYAQREELNILSTVVIDHTEIEKIKKAYYEDAFFKPIIEHPERYPQYQLLDGLLFVEDGRLCVPDCRDTRTMLLRQHHDNENHFGIAKTRGALTALYFWPNIAKDVVNYINSCSTCLRNKSTTQAPAGFLHSLPIPRDRFADIAMDFVGPIPECKGFDMLLIMTDRLTNYVRIIPTRSTATARDMAQLVYESWYRLFGLPHSIVSDRDKLFTSHFWKELHRLLDIRIKMSTAAHPETDGSSERSNKTAIEALRNYVNRRQSDWMDHLIHVETAMNNSVNATTKMTPTQLLFGTSIRLFPSFGPRTIDTRVPAVSEFIERINESVAIAKDNHLAAKTVQAHYANKHRRPEPNYKVGNKVMLDSRNIRRRLKRNGRSAKFYPRYLGPFKIIEARPESSNYKLELSPAVDFESIHPVFHAKLLRPYIPNDPKRYPAREPARPPPVVPEDNQYEVEKILDHDRRRGYLVRWAGYDQSEDSWVKEHDIHKDLVKEYKASLKK